MDAPTSPAERGRSGGRVSEPMEDVVYLGFNPTPRHLWKAVTDAEEQVARAEEARAEALRAVLAHMKESAPPNDKVHHLRVDQDGMFW